MCGRYAFSAGDEIYQRFEVKNKLEILPVKYNAAPGQNLPVITKNSPNHVSLMKWGLTVNWDNHEIRNRIINARAESLNTKQIFKNLLKSNRCLIPANGFYEWKNQAGIKTPYFFKMKNNSIFAFAGLYEQNLDDKEDDHKYFLIITTQPNKLVEKIHNRMPAILEKSEENIWLNQSIGTDELLRLIKPFNTDLMTTYPVSKMVNKLENDNENLIKKSKNTEFDQQTFF
jgi:putative SOS response-associated peptidase YedK